MKRIFIPILASLLLLSSCAPADGLKVIVRNTSDDMRTGEMVELSAADVCNRLGLAEGETFVVLDGMGSQVPYQLTYDGKLIFQVTASGESKVFYKIAKGVPEHFDTIACGKVYTDRMDDLAWENDKVAFRAYGPALQILGEKGFGYDLFPKRGSNLPVLDSLYLPEISMVKDYNFPELRKTDPDSAAVLRKTMSYHVDRGYGMDCYAVGPTLGAGVAALLEDGNIVYPWCYEKCEILDNGPLRFTAKLVFTPLSYKGNSNVVETRIITLDAGSHLNRTNITYTNVSGKAPMVSGIVLHDKSDRIVMDKEDGFIAYQDPTTGPDNGELYLGHAYDHSLADTKTIYFSDEESKARNNAKGHVLAYDSLDPEEGFTYWWGFGWNRSDIPSFKDWEDYMEDFSENLREPLKVRIK